MKEKLRLQNVFLLLEEVLTFPSLFFFICAGSGIMVQIPPKLYLLLKMLTEIAAE